MDSQRITAIALGVCWLAGIAGAFMLKSTYNDVQLLKPRMSVAESRQNEFERRIENEQESIANVLQSMQELLAEQQKISASHDARLAVLEQSTERGNVERSDMAKDIKVLLQVSYEMRAKVNTFELVE
jgi:hypothetical protein